MGETRRTGDERPSDHPEGVSLTLRPAHGQPFRWLPRHGEPLCIGEWLSQTTVKGIAFAPIYTAVIVTIMLVVLIFVDG